MSYPVKDFEEKNVFLFHIHLINSRSSDRSFGWSDRRHRHRLRSHYHRGPPRRRLHDGHPQRPQTWDLVVILAVCEQGHIPYTGVWI